VDTEQAGEKLVNRRLAYVALSRGRYDAQLYSNDKTHLTEQLARDVSHRSAIEPSRESAPSAQKIEPPSARGQVQEHLQQVGHSISKQGNSLLRFLLVEAAQAAVRCNPDWRRRYRNLAMRRQRNIAKVAMGRRLGVCLYWMWRRGWEYQQFVKFGSHAGKLGTGDGVQ
jgi:hypothetical protein